MPTVHNQDRAVDVTGCVGTKKHRSVFDVFDQPKSSQRDPSFQFLFNWFRNQRLHPSSSSDWPGGDRVHADSVTSPLNRKIFSQRIDAGLGCGNMNLHRRAEVMQRRTDVQYLTAMLLQLIERRPA